jgi:hypothetical protein
MESPIELGAKDKPQYLTVSRHSGLASGLGDTSNEFHGYNSGNLLQAQAG